MSSLLRRVLQRRDVTSRRRRRTRAKRISSATREKRRRCTSIAVDPRIRNFTEWCKKSGVYIHEDLRIGCEGSCADIGVVAESDIPGGVVLARIPRSALLNAGNSTSVARALKQDKLFQRGLSSLNSWVPLLLTLLAEKQLQSSSFWWPYLSLVPSEVCPGPAHQWTREERKRLLQGTGVAERVESDLVDMERDFDSVILPFMQRHPELYDQSSHSLQLYKDLVCFVMAYSFTDSKEEEEDEEDVCNKTMMVPFVDLLNHHSHHHAELSFHPSHLELVAVRNISQGSEVMNTYGPLSNASLMHVYGFTEEGNPHDVALIQTSVVKEVYYEEGSCDEPCDQWMEVVREDIQDDEFEVDKLGKPENSLIAMVKLLLVKKKRYNRLRDKLLSGEETELKVDSLSERERKFLLNVCRVSLRCLKEGGMIEKADSGNEKENFARRLASSQHRYLVELEIRLSSS